MDNKVYVVRCANYEQVEEQFDALLEMMGGMERFVSPGERVVLKANLLMASEPAQAITTHPAVVAAVGKRAREAGAHPVIVDSPGSGYQYNRRNLERTYEATGMDDAAQEAGVELNYDTSHKTVSYPEGHVTRLLDVITPVVEADAVLNLCKLKTHTFMAMTGAVKNHFGIIPGLSKPGYHAKLKNPAFFAGMLLDLATYTSPRLSVMDAIVGMEGDGPNMGDPCHIGLLLAATNPLALDVVASEIIGLDRSRNPVLLEAEKQGLAPHRIADVELVGATIEDLRIADYKLPATVGGTGLNNTSWWQKMLKPLFRDGLTLRPKIVTPRCIACGACRKACPVEAIAIVGNGSRHARIDSDKCIRCYCCHEMCPEEAIELRANLLYRLINS